MREKEKIGDGVGTVFHPLSSESVGRLLYRFALPSIIAMLVGSLYNVVDQFFIGRYVGELGNAATNICYPLTLFCVACALFFGTGGAAAFNIALGEGDSKSAVSYLGTAASMLFLCGVVLCFAALLWTEPMLRLFGSPENVLPYAAIYTRIVAIGFPAMIFSMGGGHLLRADGRPKAGMVFNLAGALVNTVLDALFVAVFGWGMAGAAAATIAGQFLAAFMVARYLSECKSVSLSLSALIPAAAALARVAALGVASGSNQLAVMLVQIVMNNSLKIYGAVSVYGEAIPIACAGIITKVNQLYLSFVIGTSQGMQPISSFNYGAKHYDRVKAVYLSTVFCGFIISVLAFLLFQFAPRQIISLFGDGSEAYYQFAVKYFRIYLFFTFLNFLQPVSSNFLNSIGKPGQGTFLSLARQILFLLPLLAILPSYMGIEGILYAGPAADFLSAVTAVLLVRAEFLRDSYRTPQF